MTILLLFIFIARIILWITFLTGCYFYFYLDSRYKYITQYLLLAVSFDLLITYFSISTKYNLFIWPIYSFLEFSIFSWLYYQCFLKENNKIGLPIFIVLFHGLIILDVVYLGDLYNAANFYAFSKVVADVGIILLCLLYYKTALTRQESINREMFVLNSIFISYFSINLIISLSMNFLINESNHLVFPFWILNAISASLLYLSLTYMIWQHGKTQKTLPSGS